MIETAMDRIARSYRRRPTEWVLAGITLSWGLALSSPVQTFSLSPSYRVFENIWHEQTWAGVLILFGACRILVLFINGSWFRTALLRTLASFCSLGLWLAATIAFALSGVSGVELYMCPLFIVIETNCMLEAGYEAGRCERAEIHRVFHSDAVDRFGRIMLVAAYVVGLTRAAKRNERTANP